MHFSFSDDQDQFRGVIARFCRDKSPTSQVRTLMASDLGFDPEIWQQLCQQVGLVGLHLPEAQGGSGFTAVELGIVMEEMGRHLLCSPFLSTVMASTAVAQAAGADECSTYLSRWAEGKELATLAVCETDMHFEPHNILLKATPVDDEYRLNGHKRYVVDGHSVDVILVVADTGSQLALFEVAHNAAGLTRTGVETMDATRKLAQLDFQDTPAVFIGALSPAQLGEIYNTLLVALANEMIGGAQALLDAAVEYTKLRVQFGRTVGSFQAIKHRLADLLLEVELAKTAAYQAAQALAEQRNTSEMASLAKAAASEAYLQAGIQCIQLHGGIGFTWENDTHLWFKRAKSSEVFFGGPAYHRERMLQQIIESAARSETSVAEEINT